MELETKAAGHSAFPRTKVRSLALWAPALAILAFWIQFWGRLRADWSAIGQYAFGWSVPFLALGLLYLRWEGRPEPRPLSGKARTIVLTGTVGLLLVHVPICLMEEANAGWRPLLWLREFWLVALSLAAVALLGGWRWVRHFAFPICFTAIAVPWPSMMESALIQNLTKTCAALAVEALNLAGIAAVRHGNLIEVAAGVVGVEEACSGIRGLQTSLMVSLVLGELLRFRALRRVSLVLAGIVVALVLNLFRALGLSAIAASRGLGAVDQWHDAAGFVEYGAIVALLGGLAWALGPKAGAPPNLRRRPPDALAGLRPLPIGIILLAFLMILGAAVTTATWFGLHESAFQGAPRWTIQHPSTSSESFPNLIIYAIPRQTQDLLRADEGWSFGWPGENGLDFRVFFFRWPRAGNAYVYASLGGHSPEICMPASGFVLDELVGDLQTSAQGVPLTFRQYRFRAATETVYAFYCFWEYGREVKDADPLSRNPLRSVLAGKRQQERQMVQVFITGTRDNEVAAKAFRGALEKLIVPLER